MLCTVLNKRFESVLFEFVISFLIFWFARCAEQIAHALIFQFVFGHRHTSKPLRLFMRCIKWTAKQCKQRRFLIYIRKNSDAAGLLTQFHYACSWFVHLASHTSPFTSWKFNILRLPTTHCEWTILQFG